MVIEVDGGQHGEQVAADDVRTAWLHAEGFQVLRSWNHEVLMETEAVVQAVAAAIRSQPPP